MTKRMKKRAAKTAANEAPSLAKPISAKELIASKQKPRLPHPLPPKGVDFLREIVEFNDSVGHSPYRMVGCDECIAALRTNFGWTGVARSALNKVCAHYLNRKSFGSRGSAAESGGESV